MEQVRKLYSNDSDKDYTMKVQVTQEDINKGVQYKARACPIALACARAFNKECVSVYGLIAYQEEILATKQE